jgi:hypothetical protein
LGHHQIHHVKTIKTSHHYQHKLHRVNLLSHFLRHLAECWNSKMDQFSSPITGLPKLFLSIPSSIGSNSRHFSSLVSLNFLSTHRGSIGDGNFSSLLSRADDSRMSCERRREPLLVNKLGEKAPSTLDATPEIAVDFPCQSQRTSIRSYLAITHIFSTGKFSISHFQVLSVRICPS